MENGDLQRSDPDPSLGGLDEELWRARGVAADQSVPRPRRREAAMEARGLRRAILVLTGKALAVVALFRHYASASTTTTLVAAAAVGAVGVSLAVMPWSGRAGPAVQPEVSTTPLPAPGTGRASAPGPTTAAPPRTGSAPSRAATTGAPGSRAPAPSGSSASSGGLPLPLPSLPVPLPSVSVPPLPLPSPPLPPLPSLPLPTVSGLPLPTVSLPVPLPRPLRSQPGPAPR